MKTYCFLLLILFPAYSQSELSHPLFLSQAGAGGASLKEDFSFLLNPAAIALQNKNKTALAYTFKKEKQKAFFSFADLKTQIPLAVSYQREWSKSFKHSEKDILFLSSGIKISSYFGLGVTLEKDLKNSIWNGSIGSIFRLRNQLSAGIFLNDLLKKTQERSLSLALYYNWKSFITTKLDVSKTTHQWIYRGALESVFQKFLSLRFGGTWLQKNQTGLISGGIAFQSPKFVLEYSLETNQKMNQYQQAFLFILRI